MVERRKPQPRKQPVVEPVITKSSDLRDGEYVTVQFNAGHVLVLQWWQGEQCLRIRSMRGMLSIRPTAANEIMVS